MIIYEFNKADANQFCGIYCIRIGYHTYIGSTKRTIWVRIKEHLNSVKNNKHYNKRIQSVYSEWDEIEFTVLEYCNECDVCKREQYYIDLINPDLNIVRNVANYYLKCELLNETEV